MESVDVLIVGAGPTGLTLGAECLRHKLSFRMIDRSLSAAEHSGAFLLQPRTLEQLERYGLAPAFLAAGRKIHDVGLFSARKPIAALPLAGTRSEYDYLLALPQRETERLLVEMLERDGPIIESGAEAAEIAQDADGVTVSVKHADGSTEAIRASYVVCADGAAGGLREKLGIAWTAAGPARDYIVADARVTGRAEPAEEVRVYLHKGSTFTIARLDARTCRMIVSADAVSAEADSQADDAPTIETIQRAMALCTGAEWKIGKASFIARYSVAPGKAASFRNGRVFLAGDAAAVHSPLTVQGMNAGMGDAANLIWKLAAARGAGQGPLLDSYDQERGALATRLLTTALKGLERIHMPPGPMATLRDAALPKLMQVGPLADGLRAFLTQTDVSYRGSPIVRDYGGSSAVRAGDRAPDAMIYGHVDTRQQFATWFSPVTPLVLFVDMAYDLRGAFRSTWPRARLLAIRFTRTEDDPGALRYQQDGEFSRTYVGRGDPVVYAFRPDGHVGFRGNQYSAEKLADYARSIGEDAPSDAKR